MSLELVYTNDKTIDKYNLFKIILLDTNIFTGKNVNFVNFNKQKCIAFKKCIYST